MGITFTSQIFGGAFSGSFKLVQKNSNLELISYSIKNISFDNILLAANSSANEVNLAFASGQTLNNQQMKVSLLFTGSKPSSSYIQIMDIFVDDNPGSASSVQKIREAEIPVEWQLEKNYPNPFNSETFISFQVPKFFHVTIEIYNHMG